MRNIRNISARVLVAMSGVIQPLHGQSPLPASVYTLDHSELEGVRYSPSHRVQVAGESVILPILDGYGPLQEVLGEDYPHPRFRHFSLFATGWQAKGRGPSDPFGPSSERVVGLSFFIFPTPGTPPTLKVVAEGDYARWKTMASTEAEAKKLASVVLAALNRVLSGKKVDGGVISVAGGDNDGFPFVAGKLKVSDHREKLREFYFASAITIVGRTWSMPVVVSAVDSENMSVSEDAILLAKALYHLNKDYRGPSRHRVEKSGPFVSP